MDKLLTIEEAAEALHTTVGTLRYWRHLGKGPRSAKLGGRVVYRERDLQTWIDQSFAAQTRDPFPAA